MPVAIGVSPGCAPGEAMELRTRSAPRLPRASSPTPRLPDDVLFRILDNARFAPSGGNRQGWRVIVVRDQATRDALAALAAPAAKRYAAQVQAGENPWNTVDATAVSPETIERTVPPERLTAPLRRAPVVLVICLDLKLVASLDQYLPRVGVISGASIYPFAWNILLSARQEGFGGTITTLAVAEEPALRDLLGLPAHVAVCAVMPLGQPVRTLTKLRRQPVPEFATLERWGGPAFRRPPVGLSRTAPHEPASSHQLADSGGRVRRDQLSESGRGRLMLRPDAAKALRREPATSSSAARALSRIRVIRKKPWNMPEYRVSVTGTPASRSRAA